MKTIFNAPMLAFEEQKILGRGFIVGQTGQAIEHLAGGFATLQIAYFTLPLENLLNMGPVQIGSQQAANGDSPPLQTAMRFVQAAGSAKVCNQRTGTRQAVLRRKQAFNVAT